MRYSVRHLTWYDYSRPVFLEPHVIRLQPRHDPLQQTSDYRLSVSPTPAGLAQGLDAENNPFHLAWFNGLTERLEIVAEFTALTLKANPYDSFLTCGDTLPITLADAEQRVLAPSLLKTHPTGQRVDHLIVELAEELIRDTGGKTLAFLERLNRRLFERIEKIIRTEPGFQPVSQTLSTSRGACRDTALVFMDICRYAGIPARFVSGCQEGDPDLPEAELHAWAEVYLPGFGWRGYDPTHGLAVADRHIVYAASALPENSAPLVGTFRGTGAVSRFGHEITMLRTEKD